MLYGLMMKMVKNLKTIQMNRIILDKFPIHIAITNNVHKPNRYAKINSQSIYNSNINRFTRATMVKNMHNWIKSKLVGIEPLKLEFPVQLQLDIFTVINHGNISRRNGKTIWKIPSENYVPDYDADNVSYIWEKTIKDTLSELEFWPDDNVAYCRGTNTMLYFVDDIEDRRIEISFKKVDDE